MEHAIAHILQIVEGTALVVLQIFVDRGVAKEGLEEQMRGMEDNVVDTGHRVNEGEDFDFDQNNYD